MKHLLLLSALCSIFACSASVSGAAQDQTCVGENFFKYGLQELCATCITRKSELQDAITELKSQIAHQSQASGNATYTLTVTVSSQRYADSGDTIYARLLGSSMVWSQQLLLGQDWALGETRVVTGVLSDIGAPWLVELASDGTNGWLLSTLLVVRQVNPSTGDGNTGNGNSTSFLGHQLWLGSGGVASLNVTQETPDAPSGCPVCTSHASLPPPLSSTFVPPPTGLHLEYGVSSRFRVWVDCALRGAYRFEYNASEDCGCLPRHGSFSRDAGESLECQQYKGAAYPAVLSDGVEYRYDRGHLVPANHLDGDATAISQSNLMPNILPQMDKMNRGAWLATEEIVECFRDVEPVHVLGGAVYNASSPRDDWFLASHGVHNPVFFWKVISASSLFPADHHRIAFWIPNSVEALRGALDTYVISIAQLESQLEAFGQSQNFNVPLTQKGHIPGGAWDLPTGCDKGR